MKKILGFLAALAIMAFSAMPASAQSKTVRHPTTGAPALSVTMPSDWSTQVDADKNLIITSPSRSAAFSLTIIREPASSYTLDSFAREALGYAQATGVAAAGPGAIVPYLGNTYIGKISANGQSLDLRMVIIKFDGDWYASATMITGGQTTAAQYAEAQTVLNSVKVVR
jgi:hypothetical protein